MKISSLIIVILMGILCLILPDFCIAQEIYIHTLINPCLQDKSILDIKQSYNKLQQLDLTLPILEKIEARTELDRMLTSRQEFMLRSSFNSFKQRKAEKTKLEALIQKNDTENQLIIHDIISKRYFDVLELVATIRENELIENEIQLLNQKENVSNQLLSNGIAIDLEDLINLKEDILKVSLKKESNHQKWSSQLLKLKLDSTFKFNFESFPTPADIAHHVEILNPQFLQHPDVSKYTAEEHYLRSDILAQKAKVNKILDFVQAKYTVRDDLLLQNRFSTGLGITIPWSGTYQLKKQENIIKLEENSLKKSIRIDILVEEYNQLKSQFKTEWKAYQLWGNLFKNSELEALKVKIKVSGRLDPLKILELKDSEMEASYKTWEHESKLYELYIKLLETAGLLYELPYKNYLHRLHINVE